MDPITIGTTVASLVATFTKGAQTCNTLLSRYKQAPQTLASIYTECTTIKLALSHVYWLVNSNAELLSSQLDAQGPLAETFDVALTGCTVTFSLLDVELQKLCQQSKEKESFTAKERIKFVWNEDLARSLLDDMRGLQGAVTLLLTALQTSSLAALNLMIVQQRPVIERVRQSTNSVCHDFGKTSQGRNESYDAYSIFSSAIGDEEFAFDNQLINTQVYRRVLNKAINAQFLQNADTGHKPETFDEPLIDLSDEPKGSGVPHFDHIGAGSPWFGSFDGALPADGDLALLGSGNDRTQEPTSPGDASSTQRSENGLISDRQSVKSRFAEPSVAENSLFQANKAFDIRAVACRTEQETRREQYTNEDNSGGEGDGCEADSEIVPDNKLAQGVTNQEGNFAVTRQQSMEVNGEQPPDLPNMQTTIQQTTILETTPPSPNARVSGSSNLSKATITTDDTHTSVPEYITIADTYRIVPDPLPLTIDMQSVPLAEVKRSGSESHPLILSALVWLVDPDSYTIKDSIVSNSIPETSILLFSPSMCGKSSACATYAAQKSELLDFSAATLLFNIYKIRVPIVVNKSGFTRESLVTLIDGGSNYHRRYLGNFKLDPDVILLCLPVEGKWMEIEEVTKHWRPLIREYYRKVPVILVCMMIDERERVRSDYVDSYDEGLACAKSNNVAAYVECSSTSLESINQMFETAIRLALVSKLKGQQVQTPPRRHKLSHWWKGNKA